MVDESAVSPAALSQHGAVLCCVCCRQMFVVHFRGCVVFYFVPLHLPTHVVVGGWDVWQRESCKVAVLRYCYAAAVTTAGGQFRMLVFSSKIRAHITA